MLRSNPIYLLWGLLTLAGTGWVQWAGWGTANTERKTVPKSIRDNPGAWRSHYGSTSRYYGGK